MLLFRNLKNSEINKNLAFGKNLDFGKVKTYNSEIKEPERARGRMFKCAGFTLMEIMVVTTIMIILLTVVIANYHLFGYQFALQRSANQLAQDIRRVQEMAMSAKECPAGIIHCSAGEVPKGYGVYAEKDQSYYILYADIEGNAFWNSGVDAEIENLQLEKGVIISDINTLPPKKVSINFKPPDPAINIKHIGGADQDNVMITLALEADPSRTKTITVNKAGLIEVE